MKFKYLLLFLILIFQIKAQTYPVTWTKDMEQYAPFIKEECLKRNVPYTLAMAIMYVESQGAANAVNVNRKDGKEVSRDHGLFQLNSKYLLEFVQKYGKKGRLYYLTTRPKDNIEIALLHLSNLKKILGTWNQAILAYNCGLSCVQKKIVPAITYTYLDNVIFCAQEF